jgi:lipopolysaccharide transport system ATP-binding protein
VTLNEVVLLDTAGQQIEMVAVGQAVSLRVTMTCQTQIGELVVGYMIKDRLGQPIFGTNTHHHNRKLESVQNNKQIEFHFDFQANLGPGSYSMAIALHTDDTHLAKNYEWRDNALIFTIINIDKNDFVGVAWLPPTIRCSV